MGCHFVLWGSSWLTDRTYVSCIVRWILYQWVPWEVCQFLCNTLFCPLLSQMGNAEWDKTLEQMMQWSLCISLWPILWMPKVYSAWFQGWLLLQPSSPPISVISLPSRGLTLDLPKTTVYVDKIVRSLGRCHTCSTWPRKGTTSKTRGHSTVCRWEVICGPTMESWDQNTTEVLNSFWPKTKGSLRKKQISKQQVKYLEYMRLVQN